jgi:hypothetical protein
MSLNYLNNNERIWNLSEMKKGELSKDKNSPKTSSKTGIMDLPTARIAEGRSKGTTTDSDYAESATTSEWRKSTKPEERPSTERIGLTPTMCETEKKSRRGNEGFTKNTERSDFKVLCATNGTTFKSLRREIGYTLENGLLKGFLNEMASNASIAEAKSNSLLTTYLTKFLRLWKNYKPPVYRVIAVLGSVKEV